jgi:O-antigen/teichoic acid export membrane protein
MFTRLIRKESIFTTKNNTVITNLLYVIFSNMIVFAASILTGILIPKYLSINEYGYYALFAFYSGYSYFFHFGFMDGISILFGSYDYNMIPKEKFRMYFKFLLILQIILLLIILTLYLSFNNTLKTNIYIFIGINILILNLSSFCIQINQITKRFKYYTLNTAISKLLFIILTISLLINGINNYVYFISTVLITNMIVLLILIYENKEVIFGTHLRILDNLNDIKDLLRTGFYMMIGNFIFLVIIGSGRIFVERFFTINDFAIYSFATSLTGIVLLIIDSFSTVAYPYIARTESKKYNVLYNKSQKLIAIMSGIFIAACFIFRPLISNLLPKYNDSLMIMVLLFPTIAIRAQMGIVCNNYFKVLKKQKDYIKNNITALIINVSFIVISFFCFKSIEMIALVTFLSFAMWLFITNKYFERKINSCSLKTFVYQMMYCSLFICFNYIFSWYIGLITYIAVLVLLTFFFYKNEIIELKSKKVI